MKKSKFLCIVAGQRAGTTALQSALAGTARFANFKEIFHTDPPGEDKSGYYLDFARAQQLTLDDLASTPRATQVAHAYLDHLEAMAGERTPLIDVKLNSWHALRPFWWYVHQEPFFMQQLIERGCLFLFIRRRSVLDQVLSEQIARVTQKWHQLEDAEVPEGVEVNVQQVRNQARLIIQSENFLWGCLRQRAKCVAVEYDELYQDGAVNPAVIDVLRETFEVKLPETVTPPIQKNAGKKKSIVENYAEAEDVVRQVIQNNPRPNIEWLKVHNPRA
ncbi:MAG: Stf0 family sulfotransferase [Pseudomonadota bacterium]